MRAFIVILVLSVTWLGCGNKVTESIKTDDGTITLAGNVYFEGSSGVGVANCWVIYGTMETATTDSVRVDSTMTDDTGRFRFDGAQSGELWYELYREPRSLCFGNIGQVTANSSVTSLIWLYVNRPTCTDSVLLKQ